MGGRVGAVVRLEQEYNVREWEGEDGQIIVWKRAHKRWWWKLDIGILCINIAAMKGSFG